MQNETDIQNFYGNQTYQNLMEYLKTLHSTQAEAFVLDELHLYGSSRLGVLKTNLTLVEFDNSKNIIFEAQMNEEYAYRDLGSKRFELSNHLGNVLVTVSDKLVYVEDNGDVDYFEPEVTSISDYYPFGSAIYSRSFSGEYRYGYGGHEKLDEVSGSGNTVDMGDRWLDMRLGRTPKIDAKGGKYPFVSPYAYALNNPIIYNDPDGKDVYLVIYTTKEGDVGHAAIAVENYKKVETKVIENGQEITKTEWVKDGTLTYYELGPASPLNGAKDAFKNVEALYGEFNVTLDNVINDPISRYESSAPDGIIKFETSAETDLAIHEKLKSKTNEPYNATGNNCSDYAGCGADMASSDGKVKRKEFLIFPIRSSTPNKLFQNAKKASNATVIQDAGKQANKKFRKAYKGPTESSEPSTPVPDEE